MPARPETGRIRAAGGGRKRLEDADPHVKRVLARLVEANTAGDPMSYRLWTNKSTRTLAEELAPTATRSPMSRWRAVYENWATPCRPT